MKTNRSNGTTTNPHIVHVRGETFGQSRERIETKISCDMPSFRRSQKRKLMKCASLFVGDSIAQKNGPVKGKIALFVHFVSFAKVDGGRGGQIR